MNVQELRIGNYLHDAKDRLCRVEKVEFDKYGGYAPAIKGGVTVFPNKPIPLTEQWLKELGFFEGKLTFTGDDGYVINGDKFYIGLMKKENGWSFHNPHFDLTINYVHQLQNLYFSLVGTELTCAPQS